MSEKNIKIHAQKKKHSCSLFVGTLFCFGELFQFIFCRNVDVIKTIREQFRMAGAICLYCCHAQYRNMNRGHVTSTELQREIVIVDD